MNNCFACGRKLGKSPKLADTRDDQIVQVGNECYKLIKAAGNRGYQPPRGGPRLFLLKSERANNNESRRTRTNILVRRMSGVAHR